MKEIYNQGRVAGLSSYDLYVRQYLSTNPEGSPIPEKEWLTSSICTNSSMILKVPAGTEPGCYDYQLPENSSLCGCTVIYAAIFEGEVIVSEDSNWALMVTDYGRLISNNEHSYPETPGTPSYVPSKDDPITITPRFKEQCYNYMKITGGRLFQPGDWTETGQDAPFKMLNPDFSATGFVRLAISEPITIDVYLILNGFAHSPFIDQVYTSINPDPPENPESGDFLGPIKFPWACPIIMTATNDSLYSWISDVNAELDMLDERVRYLGSLHTVVYNINLANEDTALFLTEDGKELIVPKRGTVTEMWDEGGIL